MLFRPTQEDALTEIDERLRLATAPNPHLFRLLISKGCTRLTACSPRIRNRLYVLVDTGAYADAALCLLELELPSWKLRRVVSTANGIAHSRELLGRQLSWMTRPMPVMNACQLPS